MGTRNEKAPLDRAHRSKDAGAVVIGGSYRGLAVARSLGRHGIPVWLLSGPHMVTSASRYVRRTLPWPDGEDATRADYLLQAGTLHGLDRWALFPTDDDDAAMVARHRERLSELFLPTTPPWETMRRVHDKRLLYELASELGIDQPWTAWAMDRENLRQFKGMYPVILKPAMKEGETPFTFAKAWKVESQDELLARYDEARTQIDPRLVMVQEYIPGIGNDYAFGALCRAGEPLVSLVAWRPRQYPIDFGRASTYVQTVDLPEVEEPARRLLAATGVTGLAHVGFKLDVRDGRYKLLDVNLRAWGSHALGRQAGVDFPYLLWKLIHGDPVEEMRAPTGLSWIRLTSDLPTAARLIWHGHLSLRDYVRSMRGPKEHAVLAADDPLPALVDLPLLVLRLWKRGRPAKHN